MEDMVSKDLLKKEIDPLVKENQVLSSQLLQAQEKLQQKELQHHQLSEQFQYLQQEIIQKLLKTWKDFQSTLGESVSQSLSTEEAFLPGLFRRILEERNEYTLFSDHLRSFLPNLIREERLNDSLEEINHNSNENSDVTASVSIVPDPIIVHRRSLDRMTKFSFHLRQVLQQLQYFSTSPSPARRPATIRTSSEAEALSQQLLSLEQQLPSFLHDYHQEFQSAVEDYQSLSNAYRSLQSECQELRLQRQRSEETIQWMKDQKQSLEERHQQELSLLQKELNQSFADQEALQEEHSKYLTKMKEHWEERMKQQQQLIQSQSQDEQQLLQVRIPL